jgi:hypothetical protein
MNIPDEIIERFLKRSSYTGLNVVYALSLSYEKHIAFNFLKYFERLFPNSYDYCFGFAIACTSFGLVEFNIKEGIMTVASINLSSSKIKEKFLERYEDETLHVEINKTEEYFS